MWGGRMSSMHKTGNENLMAEIQLKSYFNIRDFYFWRPTFMY